MSASSTAFSAARLVCPRCRRAGHDGRLVRYPLSASVEGARVTAVPGMLDGVGSVECTNAACLARYPVVEGIPVVFADAGAIDLANAGLLDVTANPAERLLAAVQGQVPEAPLSALVARLSRICWAAFHDWMGDDGHVPGVACEVHAVQFVRWLREHPTGTAVDEPINVVAGAGAGRESWEIEQGTVLLLDAHLPSLLASRRLRTTGSIDLLLREGTTGWKPLTLRARRSPAAQVAEVCCDMQDPPFDAGWAGQVLLPNVVDSVANPYLVLMQSRAMVGSGGSLTVCSPFTWRAEVTPQDRWLERLASLAGSGPQDVVTALITEQPPGQFAPAGSAELSWCTRVSNREAIVYRNSLLRYVRVAPSRGPLG